MERLANQIAKALIEAGLEATVDRSGLSSSAYVEADGETGIVRVRVSDHVSRPTYERLTPSQFHVGTIVRQDGRVEHVHQDSDGDWLDAVVFVCRRFSVAVPSRIQRRITKRDHAVADLKAAEQTRIEAEQTARQQQAANREAAIERLSAAHREVLAHYETLHGKERKKLRTTGRYRQAKAALEQEIG